MSYFETKTADATWQRARIGDICERITTIDPRKNPKKEFVYIDVSGVSNKTFSIEKTNCILGQEAPSRARRLVNTGDVLFATVRPMLLRIAQLPKELDGAVCSTGYIVLRPKPKVNARFLFYSLFRLDFLSNIENLQSGASYPAVNDTQVRRQWISFPNLEEQKRIVAKLDQAFAALDRAQANVEANLVDVTVFFKNWLVSKFSYGLESYPIRHLADISEILDKKRVPISKSKRKPGNIPYYGATGVLDWVNDYIFDEPLILVGEDGAKWGPGENTAFLISGKTWVNNHAHVLKPNRNRVLDDWLRYFLNAADLNKFVSGATVPKLNQTRLRQIPIPLPSIEEQKRIVILIDQAAAALDRIRTLIEENLAEIGELRQSLLQKAFAGELT